MISNLVICFFTITNQLKEPRAKLFPVSLHWWPKTSLISDQQPRVKMHRATSREKFSSAKLPKELDQYIVDPTTKKRYHRGRFLGKVHTVI